MTAPSSIGRSRTRICCSALRLLAEGVERGFYTRDYIAVHCPFLAALRSRPEFQRIVERAAARVAAFSA